MTSCDVIIPVFDQPDMTMHCLESIRTRTDSPYNFILIDNASSGQTENFLEGFKASSGNVNLIRNRQNLGWVKAINQGMRLSRAHFLCIMNNDTVVRTDGWLSKLIAIADSARDIGLVNPYFSAKKKTPAEAAFIEIDFCRGFCMLIKRVVMERIGLLDEAYGIGYYDDDDYSIRAIRAGFRCVRANHVFVEHLRDSTFSSLFERRERGALHEKNKALFYSKWGRRLRLAFIITNSADRKVLSDLLLSLARAQHIIYLWSAARGACEPAHINIRFKVLPPIFRSLFFAAELCLNKIRGASKRYDIIFVDDAALGSRLSGMRQGVYRVSIEKDAKRILNLADAASRNKTWPAT